MADLLTLRQFADGTFAQVVAQLCARRLSWNETVLAVMDARRFPGRELASWVHAEEQRIDYVEARRFVDGGVTGRRGTAVPFMVGALVQRDTLFQHLCTLALASPTLDETQRWLRRPTARPNLRVLLIAGERARTQTLRIE